MPRPGPKRQPICIRLDDTTLRRIDQYTLAAYRAGHITDPSNRSEAIRLLITHALDHPPR